MQPSQEVGIKWNEVTWYSKLGAAILLLVIVPALSFYIGMQYGNMKSPPVDTAMLSEQSNEPSVDKTPQETNSVMNVSNVDMSTWVAYEGTASYPYSFKHPPSWKVSIQEGGVAEALINDENVVTVYDPATGTRGEGGSIAYESIEVRPGHLAECLWSSGDLVRREIPGGVALDLGWEGWVVGTARMVCASDGDRGEYTVLLHSNAANHSEQAILEGILSTFSLK